MMPRTVQQILDHADELARRFEDYEPAPGDRREVEPHRALASAARARAQAEREVAHAVGRARASGYTWKAIGEVLGTSGEAARLRYGTTVRKLAGSYE